MSTTIRRGLSYGLVALAAIVSGLLTDSGLLLLLGAVLIVVGFLHTTRGRSARIEDERARAEASVRDGNAEPERHGGW